MKKKLLLLGLVASLTLSSAVFTQAQEINNSSITNEISENYDSEISKGDIPYNPNIKIDAPYGDIFLEEHNVLSRSMPNGGFGANVVGISSGYTLNVRKSPTTSSSIVGALRNGTEVTMGYYRQGYRDGHWWRYICAYDVNGNHVHGYVAEDYLSSKIHVHAAGSTPCCSDGYGN